MSIKVEVIHGDAIAYRADILSLKFAQRLFGVDRLVVSRLSDGGIDVVSRLPNVGESLVVAAGEAVAAREILFVGVEPMGRFDYQSIRKFAHSVLSILKRDRPSAAHVAMTLHGVGFGLDEAEAFRSEVAGLLDAVAARDVPPTLMCVSIVEYDAEAAARLTTLLTSIIPSGTVGDRMAPRDDRHGGKSTAGAVGGPVVVAGSAANASLTEARANLGDVGHDSRQKPHVFVAMPFAEEYADRFHYGISGAVQAAGFLCERADLASFTGDVLGWVRERIDSSALVVADLSAANPNVYLEVGYAWGRGVRTVLIVARADELKFDVRGQRCLVFSSIRHLQELLTAELKNL